MTNTERHHLEDHHLKDQAPPTGKGDGPIPGTVLAELAAVDPATLIIGVNARTEVDLDAHFCRDVADRGVREPITVRRDDTGRLVVRKGQRRTLAAVKAGLARVPVLIDPEPDTEDTAARIDRIVDQYAENFHRKAMSEADEARAHQQLLDLGLSAGQIARKTHLPAKRVRVLGEVNRSAAARAALQGADGYVMTLDQAATIAEFDDGSDTAEHDAAELREIAEHEPEQFSHTAQRIRDEREEQRITTDAAAKLVAEGLRVLTAEETGTATRLGLLRPTEQDSAGTELRPEDHTGCPGRAVHLSCHRNWHSGELTLNTSEYCTQPALHAPRYPDWAPRQQDDTHLSEEEQQQRKERKSAELKRVKANNKAWDSATVVRRQWLTELVARKKTPHGAATYIAATLTIGSYDLRHAMERGHRTACALLNLPEPTYSRDTSELTQLARESTGTRATQICLAVLLGAHEDGTTRDSWRNPSGATIDYFTLLREWGYSLSAVERLVLQPAGDEPQEPAPSEPDSEPEPSTDASAPVDN
jgi:ParB family chromosome partitioning protein